MRKMLIFSIMCIAAIHVALSDVKRVPCENSTALPYLHIAVFVDYGTYVEAEELRLLVADRYSKRRVAKQVVENFVYRVGIFDSSEWKLEQFIVKENLFEIQKNQGETCAILIQISNGGGANSFCLKPAYQKTHYLLPDAMTRMPQRMKERGDFLENVLSDFIIDTNYDIDVKLKLFRTLQCLFHFHPDKNSILINRVLIKTKHDIQLHEKLVNDVNTTPIKVEKIKIK